MSTPGSKVGIKEVAAEANVSIATVSRALRGLHHVNPETRNKILASNVVLILCFVFMWLIVGWMLNRDFNTIAYQVKCQAELVPIIDNETGVQELDKNEQPIYKLSFITDKTYVSKIKN